MLKKIFSRYLLISLLLFLCAACSSERVENTVQYVEQTVISTTEPLLHHSKKEKDKLSPEALKLKKIQQKKRYLALKRQIDSLKTSDADIRRALMGR